MIGDPATYVYADRLSAAAILDAFKAGRVYVSRRPVLDIEAEVDGEVFPLGSGLTEPVGYSEAGFVRCRLAVPNAAAAVPHVIGNGAEIAVHPVSKAVSEFEFRLDWKADAGYVWRRFELRSNSGELLAFTNPISCGSKTKSIATCRRRSRAGTVWLYHPLFRWELL
ncbi:hypothetical protein IJ21_00990 [Paenibacillus sp. 32O-W]|uniref:hypothetical protein n=1 Tax=Paenibacillus sp. 32O-W TaxID=1695218 RepID=UPI0007217120|nr:hypothetical protein [Paenibacillus sp. 32O-W]ALS25554.1 hypothetical protein IJ21_00990 [Paenibacillus sp. 32O-W]